MAAAVHSHPFQNRGFGKAKKRGETKGPRLQIGKKQ